MSGFRNTTVGRTLRGLAFALVGAIGGCLTGLVICAVVDVLWFVFFGNSLGSLLVGSCSAGAIGAILAVAAAIGLNPAKRFLALCRACKLDRFWGMFLQRVAATSSLISAVSTILWVLGLYGWFSGSIAAVDSSSTFESPLGDLEGVAVDAKGNIYCALHFYSRVQVYDPDGRFLRWWHVDAGGGAFRMRINADDQLEVATSRTNGLYVFDSHGKLLSRSAGNQYFASFGEQGEWSVRGSDGAEYAIRGRFMFPRIIKIPPTGTGTTVVSQPWYNWVVMGPFPAFSFVVSGGLMSLLVIRATSRFGREMRAEDHQAAQVAAKQSRFRSCVYLDVVQIVANKRVVKIPPKSGQGVALRLTPSRTTWQAGPH